MNPVRLAKNCVYDMGANSALQYCREKSRALERSGSDMAVDYRMAAEWLETSIQSTFGSDVYGADKEISNG
jgi:hypothetical protein